MNYHRKSGILFVFLLFLLLSVFATPNEKISAASGKTVYSATWLKEEKNPKYGIISSVKVNKNSMVVNGSLAKGNSQRHYYKKGKKKFHLSSKVKFYIPNGMNKTKKASKKEFVKLCRHLNQTANCQRFRFVVENDRVVKISVIA